LVSWGRQEAAATGGIFMAPQTTTCQSCGIVNFTSGPDARTTCIKCGIDLSETARSKEVAKKKFNPPWLKWVLAALVVVFAIAASLAFVQMRSYQAKVGDLKQTLKQERALFAVAVGNSKQALSMEQVASAKAVKDAKIEAKSEVSRSDYNKLVKLEAQRKSDYDKLLAQNKRLIDTIAALKRALAGPRY
jgi:DNA-binding transcriptional regulator of glucitol operon/ribosomal protein L37E